MAGIPTQVKKSSKQLVQDMARKVAQEPSEILKQAKEEVLGTPEPEEEGGEKMPSESQVTEQQKEQIKAQGARQLQALENELKEIRLRKAQEKMVASQEEATEAQGREEEGPLVEPTPKKGRKLMGTPGPRLQVQREKTHVERIRPTSG
jgi:hypothetical protein